MDRGIVEQYWGGVAQRLQAEVDVFNKLIMHNAEVGRENEASLTSLLSRLLPAGYGLGTGIIIDSSGRRSKQCDVIIYDHGNQPRLLAQTSQMIFPVEMVQAVIEVKTTLTAAEITDFRLKKDALQNLSPAVGYSLPTMGIFSYRFAGSSTNVMREALQDPIGNRPDFACVVDPGVVGHGGSHALQIGYAPLHVVADDGLRISESWMAPPAEAEALFAYRGSVYPTFRPEVGGNRRDRLCGDPGRALLLFMEQLLGLLPGPTAGQWMGKYLTDISRELLEVKKVAPRVTTR